MRKLLLSCSASMLAIATLFSTAYAEEQRLFAFLDTTTVDASRDTQSVVDVSTIAPPTESDRKRSIRLYTGQGS